MVLLDHIHGRRAGARARGALRTGTGHGGGGERGASPAVVVVMMVVVLLMVIRH
jgi:hypothetical protein